jgi:hypothetical protein
LMVVNQWLSAVRGTARGPSRSRRKGPLTCYFIRRADRI